MKQRPCNCTLCKGDEFGGYYCTETGNDVDENICNQNCENYTTASQNIWDLAGYDPNDFSVDNGWDTSEW